MRYKHVIFLVLAMSLACFGCKKSTDSPAPSTDLAQPASGIYHGTWTVPGTGQVSGTCEVIKVSNTTVDLKMTAGGVATPTVPKVKLSDGGNGKTLLTYSDASGTLDGNIQNNVISLTLVSGSTATTFSGNRQ